jgi:hypothetical protein
LTDQPRDASASREMNMAEDRNGFWLLAAGALLFAAAFLIGMEWLDLDQMAQGPVSAGALLALATAAFGLPYAAREVLYRKTNWLLVAFLLLLIPIFHAVGAGVFSLLFKNAADAAAAASAAADAAAMDPSSMVMQAAPPEPTTTPQMLMGLAAGAAGAAGPLLLLALLPWLRARGARPWLFAAALVALAWWGAMSVRQVTVANNYDLAVTVFLPWQILLAFFLSHLLRASPPKDAPAP